MKTYYKIVVNLFFPFVLFIWIILDIYFYVLLEYKKYIIEVKASYKKYLEINKE